MRRREFITGLCGAAAWPRAARAQQPAVPVVGWLGSGSPDGNADRMRAFHQSLSESGFVAGRNVTIEYRWANDQRSVAGAYLIWSIASGRDPRGAARRRGQPRLRPRRFQSCSR